MQKDKQRIAHGDVLREVSDKEFFNGKLEFDESTEILSKSLMEK